MSVLKKLKRKEKKEKTPKVKKISGKKGSMIVSMGLVFLLTVAFVGAIRANVMASNVAGIRKDVKQLKNANEITPIEVTQIDYPSLNYYVENFMMDYITLDGKEKDNNKRLEKLAKYLSFDAKELEAKVPNQVSRQLKSVSLIKVEDKQECYFVYTNVSYEVIEDKKKTAVSEEFVLPIQMKENVYAIVSKPFVVTSSLPTGKTKALQGVETPIEVDEKEKKALEKFLTLFFEKYSLGNKDDLELLMKQPELTTGNDKLLKVETDTIKYFDTKQKNVRGIQVAVSFENKLTGLIRTESFSLWVSQTENSYFINTLKHYYTENEG